MSWHSVYNIWVTSTIVWSWQLHASSVRDMLQISRDASNFNQSLITVVKLLPFDLFAESLNQHFWCRGWCFFDLTHLPLEELLGCMVVVEL